MASLQEAYGITKSQPQTVLRVPPQQPPIQAAAKKTTQREMVIMAVVGVAAIVLIQLAIQSAPQSKQ
jgi:hypothetical protein